MDSNETVLDGSFSANQHEGIRRRKLLPGWIKFFIWVFMIFGAIAPVGLLLGAIGFSFELSALGLHTYNPISMVGLFLIATFLFSGIAAFGLWTEKDWAIEVAITDAFLSIAICLYAMFLSSAGFSIIRLELVILIPYLIKLFKIRPDWKKAEIGLT